MITITLYWWYGPIILFLIPIIYGYFYKPSGCFDFGLGPLFVLTGCWPSAIIWVLVKLLN